MTTLAYISIAICCIIVNIVSMTWITYQITHFVNNPVYQQHRAFKIRGKKMFFLTAFVLILNFIFRPILVACSVIFASFAMNSMWRLIIDLAGMSLYAIIELRCWVTYFNLNSSTAIVDRQWKKYLNERATSDFFINYQKYCGNDLYVGIFFCFHGILCVIICGVVEEHFGFYPHRIICHFFTANILLFLLFIHRIYSLLFGVKHTYSHDMLAINKELNLITFIMTITAFCDCAVGIWHHSTASVFYVVYQTILIGLLSIIIFYLPQTTTVKLLQVENQIKKQRKHSQNSAKLKHIFMDSDLYHSFIRFLVSEWSTENLLFISQWMQLQKIIVDSGINVKTNPHYSCEESLKCNILSIPSDILLFSHNILEASRGMYDKFVKTNDILEINISMKAKQRLTDFFTKHSDIECIFGTKKQINNSIPLNERTTTVVVDKKSDNNNTENTNHVKYKLFMQQLKNEEIDCNIIQEMVDAFECSAVKDCWDNCSNSFQRFQSTINYKINSSYFKLPQVKK